MIVAIASDDGMRVAGHPGRCGGFVVFEIGRSSAVRVGYRSNACTEATEAMRRGAHAAADQASMYQALIAVLSDCNALVSHHMEDGLVRALQNSVIDAYECREESVDQAAQSFAQGHLRKVQRKGC